jgi:Uma2 family endonuclease
MASITTSVPSQHVPPLQNGDRLTRPEFERRFDATPDLKFAELIEGVVYMPPPISHEFHSRPHLQMCSFVGAYIIGTPGIDGGDSGSIRLDLDNMPQPDTYLFIEPGRGGQARLSDDGYVEGAPEWIGEVSASTASYDLHAKLNVYRRNGVQEHLVLHRT